MNPQALKNLRKSPEFDTLVKYLAGEALKLNTLDGMEKLPFEERAYEVTARKLAFDTLTTILEGIVEVQEFSTGTSAKEYAM